METIRNILSTLFLFLTIISIFLIFNFLNNNQKIIYIQETTDLDNKNKKEKEIIFEDNIINLNPNRNNDYLELSILESLPQEKIWLINLTKKTISLYENKKLREIIPIAYQAPEDKWYQTPMGYFRIGIKKEKHYSSLFPVYMNYSVQLYEDFFIHEIPYFLNGEMVTNNFTGGCLRLDKENSKKFYDLVKEGDFVLVYKELFNYNTSDKFTFPVKKDEFYLLKNFNSPFRMTKKYSGDLKNLKKDYVQHTAIDLSPYAFAKDLNVYSIYDGEVTKIVKNGEGDHGMGNTVIIEHLFNLDEVDNNYLKEKKYSLDIVEKEGKKYIKIYSLYAHLSEIKKELSEGTFVKKGEIIGKVGNTAYGCNYWRIGEDGCDKNSPPDIHLHFEIKEKPVLESPKPTKCFLNGIWKNCYGYIPHNPIDYGYFDPLKFLSK